MLLKNLFEEIARTGQGSTAVVGWGRGMGHKGHMMLASSVITKSKEVGGDPYFVVSRVVGKDDPLTADEKISIYKKVFPEQGHIFQAASDDIPSLTGVLTNLNQQGYNNVTVVVGSDQVKAFQYLKNYNNKPDKSGNIAFNFDNLDIISRQETGDPSAGEEGPRATPMRQILNDPKATPDQQFQVWRDAMSPELSDEEVMDLMNKAKERMGQFAKPKAKTSAAVNELSSELLGRYKKAAGADASAADKAGNTKKADKRFSGIVKATKKQFANDEKGVAEGLTTEKQILTRIRQIMYDRKLSGTESNAGELLRLKQQLKDVRSQQGVAEGSSKAIAQAASRLTDPKDGAVAKLRAAGDKRREDDLKSRNIAKKNENINISESVDPKVSIVFDKYNPPDKDSIDGWKVAAKTKYWMVGTNKVKKDPKNPLPHEVKLVCIETAMPRVEEHLEIVDDWLALAVKAYKKYGDIELVVCTRQENIFKQILQKNGHQGKHGYFKFDKITKVATPYYRHDKELKKALVDKDKTAFKRASGISPDKRVVAEHNRYEYFDLLEKFMIKRTPIVSLNESKVIPISESIESQMENLIKRLENK